MKRTSPWVWVAFAAVQLAALGLCTWVMERERETDADALEDVRAPREALAPAPPPSATDVAFVKKHPVPEPVVRPVQPMEPRESARVEGAPPATPRLGPPPAPAEAAPPYITDVADATTQIVAGKAGERSVIFGFYPDGNIRCVDVDGARYRGKATGGRARLREDDGTRAFTVELRVGADGRLAAAFTGGNHDGETIALDPVAGVTR